MNRIIEDKKQLRKIKSRERVQLEKGYKLEYDKWICDKIWEIVISKKVKVMHCYLPMGTEIDITPLIEKMLENRLTVVTPKTLPQRQLQNLVLHAMDRVEKGVFGTTHPANSDEFTGSYDLVIIPGLAYDSSKYRLGYGGGYYDTFLAQNPNVYKLGIFYPFQEIEKVPIEEHDVQLDEVLVKT